ISLLFCSRVLFSLLLFSFPHTAPPDIYTLSLHDALPISLHLTDVPWKQALQTVVKSAGLITRQEGNILSVHSIAWQNNNIARQEAEQARAQANLPLENRSITLQYADAGEIGRAHV